MTRIYTKKGDDGNTSLAGGKRVSKDSPRIEAVGSIDELNAEIGTIRCHSLPEKVDALLQRIQNDLFTIGADLARPPDAESRSLRIQDEDTAVLEKEIDNIEASLEPLKQFILPGGGKAGAAIHVARTVARRAERRCVALSRIEAVDPGVIRYLNRLSDLCFVLARYINQHESRSESQRGK